MVFFVHIEHITVDNMHNRAKQMQHNCAICIAKEISNIYVSDVHLANTFGQFPKDKLKKEVPTT